jgi:hypothetical protein
MLFKAMSPVHLPWTPFPVANYGEPLCASERAGRKSLLQLLLSSLLSPIQDHLVKNAIVHERPLRLSAPSPLRELLDSRARGSDDFELVAVASISQRSSTRWDISDLEIKLDGCSQTRLLAVGRMRVLLWRFPRRPQDM